VTRRVASTVGRTISRIADDISPTPVRPRSQRLMMIAPPAD
jgi:hypothetical protein